jgi:hypothetical protein
LSFQFQATLARPSTSRYNPVENRVDKTIQIFLSKEMRGITVNVDVSLAKNGDGTGYHVSRRI